jgi:hypothetical protein
MMFACLASTVLSHSSRRRRRSHEYSSSIIRDSNSSHLDDSSYGRWNNSDNSSYESRSSNDDSQSSINVSIGKDNYYSGSVKAKISISAGSIVFPYCKKDEDCCEALSKITCMIKCRCKSGNADCLLLYNNLPYYQFGSFLSFVDSIPVVDAKAAYGWNSKDFNKKLHDYISSLKNYNGFSTLVPYFYNVDMYNGFCGRCYDIRFLNWFINSFKLYLGHLCENLPNQLPTGEIYGDKFCYRSNKEQIDLLCITECRQCTFIDPAYVFNKIISSTVTTPRILRFVEFAIAQIRCCCRCPASRSCAGCNNEIYSTRESYKDVFIAGLESVRRIVLDAYAERAKYYDNGANLLAFFASVPYISSAAAVNLANFMLIPSTSLDLAKLINF